MRWLSPQGFIPDWHIHLPEPLAVSELDLTALFGNLMENAIAGCLSLPERSLFFPYHGNPPQNSLYIVSTNSFDGHVRKEKDRYRSTKHSGSGIGLASITATAESYGGSAPFPTTTGSSLQTWFCGYNYGQNISDSQLLPLFLHTAGFQECFIEENFFSICA